MRRPLALLVVAALVGALALPASAAAQNQSPCVGVDVGLATITMPDDYWALGAHTYQVKFTYDNGAASEVTDPVAFTVTTSAPAFEGPVFLRYNGLSSTPGPATPAGSQIRPGQSTVFFGGHLIFIGWDFATRNEALAFWAAAGVEFSWDGGPWIAGQKLPLTSACAGGFFTTSNEQLHVMGPLRRHYE